MAVQATDIADLVNATRDKYRKNFMSDAVTTLQDYTAMRELLKKNRISFDSGPQYKFPVMHTADTNTRPIGFFEVDDLNQVDGTALATVPWRFIETGTHFDVKQVAVNEGSESIFNFVKKLEYQMWVNYFETCEGYFWMGNSTGSADAKTPYGLLGYWLSYTGLSSTPGLNGANHANWSDGPGGIDSTTYTGWKHPGATYTAISTDDALRSMRKLYRLAGFKGIPNKPIDSGDVSQRYGIYTTLDNLTEFEELLENKNENIGMDLAKYDNATMFRRVMLEWVPYLQTNHTTSDPIIGIDWSDMRTAALRSQWMRETPYHQSGTQHDVRQMFVNTSFNTVMHIRRKHFLMAKSNPMSD